VAVVAGALTGEVQVGLFLFFIPYLTSSSGAGAAAMLLVFAGITVLLLSAMVGASPSGEDADNGGRAPPASGPKAKGEFGGVVLIGPVPIVFGSSSRPALIALALAAMIVMGLMLAMLLIM
jgi:uncharacterized protein (TIGR00304 family)